jgi:hypothetical protein
MLTIFREEILAIRRAGIMRVDIPALPLRLLIHLAVVPRAPTASHHMRRGRGKDNTPMVKPNLSHHIILSNRMVAQRPLHLRTEDLLPLSSNMAEPRPINSSTAHLLNHHNMALLNSPTTVQVLSNRSLVPLLRASNHRLGVSSTRILTEATNHKHSIFQVDMEVLRRALRLEVMAETLRLAERLTASTNHLSNQAMARLQVGMADNSSGGNLMMVRIK